MEVTTNKDMKDAIDKEKYLSYKLKHMTSWALVVKLCDRLDNINSLNKTPEKFKNRYIAENNFIIDYLEKNRKLSKTHKAIIEDIKAMLETYKYKHYNSVFLLLI